ncbi:MAG: hypothetical protein AB1341_14580 [Bacillota bacterium]
MTSGSPAHCPLTEAAHHRTSAFMMLSFVRDLRDTLLCKTEKGRHMMSLYKLCSPTLVKVVLLDPRFRTEILDGLEKLKPAIAGVKKTLEGHSRTYIFTQEDAQTVSYLLDLSVKRLPRSLAMQMQNLKKDLHLDSMPGKSVTDYLTSVKLL